MRQVYQGEGWLILSGRDGRPGRAASVSRGGVVDSQPVNTRVRVGHKCIKGRGG